MIRVVADTNIFISALMFGGLPSSFLDLAFLGSFRLVTSPALLDELDEKLRVKFEVASEDADLIRARLERVSLIVKPDLTLTMLKRIPKTTGFWNALLRGKQTTS
jgi:uncharacterized protein